MRKLMPHQEDALRYAKASSYVALFLEMRLGKTLVAIRWALHQTQRQILIVAPKSVLPVWEKELQMEGVAFDQVCSIKGNKSLRISQANSRNYRVFLINFESLRATPELCFIPWECLIIDESTKIRNPKAQITKLLTKKFREVPARAILSGLPAPQSPLDYFCQMQFLHGHFMQCYSYWQFRKRYFYQSVFEWLPMPKTLTRIKEEVHSLAFTKTRKEVNIGSQKIYENRYIEMTPEQKKLYRQVNSEFSYEELETKWALTKFTWMARIAGGFSPDEKVISDRKSKELLDLLQNDLAEEQVIIWFRFSAEMARVKEVLTLARITCHSISGEDTATERLGYIESFLSNKARVLLCQIKCGRFGLNLSNASTAIYYSNSYDYEDRAQSEDRILHPSKREPLLYIDLITKDTIDEDVVNILRDKSVSSRLFMTKLTEKWKEKYKCISP